MKYPHVLVILAILLALAMTLTSALTEKQEEVNMLDHEDEDEDDDDALETLNNERHLLASTDQAYISLRGSNRFLSPKMRSKLTCNKYPRICRTKGSSGPNCCKKKCVNVRTNRLNCGRCGKKCKFSELCCNGRCVNPLKHNSHCGGCGNRCSKGSSCGYGICGYA